MQERKDSKILDGLLQSLWPRVGRTPICHQTEAPLYPRQNPDGYHLSTPAGPLRASISYSNPNRPRLCKRLTVLPFREPWVSVRSLSPL